MGKNASEQVPESKSGSFFSVKRPDSAKGSQSSLAKSLTTKEPSSPKANPRSSPRLDKNASEMPAENKSGSFFNVKRPDSTKKSQSFLGSKRPDNDKTLQRPPSGKKPTTSPKHFTFEQKQEKTSPKGSPAGSPKA